MMAESAAVKDFLRAPNADKLFALKKSELLELCTHLNIPNVKKGSSKSVIAEQIFSVIYRELKKNFGSGWV